MITARTVELENNLSIAKHLANKFKISEERASEILSYLSKTLHITDNTTLVTLFTFIAIHIPSILRISEFALFPMLAVHEIALTTLKWIEFIRDTKKNGFKMSNFMNLLGESAPSFGIVVGVLLAVAVLGSTVAPILIATGLATMAGHDAARGIYNLVKALRTEDIEARKRYLKKAKKYGVSFTGNALATAGVIVAGIFSHGIAGGAIGGAGALVLLVDAIVEMIRYSKIHDDKNELFSPFQDIRSGTTVEVKPTNNHRFYNELFSPFQDIRSGTTVEVKSINNHRLSNELLPPLHEIRSGTAIEVKPTKKHRLHNEFFSPFQEIQSGTTVEAKPTNNHGLHPVFGSKNENKKKHKETTVYAHKSQNQNSYFFLSYAQQQSPNVALPYITGSKFGI